MKKSENAKLIYSKPGIRISLIDDDTVYTEYSGAAESYSHDYYQSGYLDFRSLREALFSEVVNAAFLRGASKEKTWLDYGSGCGIFLNVLEKHGYTGLSGIDPSCDACKIASGITSADIINRDPLEMPEQEIAPADVISVLDVIAHVPDPEKTLQWCFNHLKDDGMCVLKTPHRSPEYVEFCLRHFKNSPEFIVHLLHARYQKYSWSFDGIARLFRKAGFQQMECIPFHEMQETDYRFELPELWHPRRFLYRSALRRSRKIQSCTSMLIFARKNFLQHKAE